MVTRAVTSEVLRFQVTAIVFCALAAGLAMRPAVASTVYPGCAVPGPSPTGRAFYVDPANGSPAGDGSRAHPWRTLTEVVADGLISTAPPKSPRQALMHDLMHGDAKATVGPGDTLYLMSGQHGAVTLQGYFGKDLVGYDNPQFITIAALPGQTPVLSRLKVIGGSRWVFRGLTFESLNDSGEHAQGGTANRDYWLVSLLGPHQDIVFENDHVLSQADVSGWEIEDWLDKRASGVMDVGGQCISITDNDIHNIGFAIQTQRSSRVIIAGNSIDYFTDDGIDYGSSQLLITNNKITNSIEDGDKFHRDAMQGQPYDGSTTVTDVTISDNTVIRVLDPHLKFPGFLQGNDTFDGVWRNVSVRHNVVITDSSHGISYYGVHDIQIDNNVVLNDGGKLLPCYNIGVEDCKTKAVSVENTSTPTIHISPSKTGDPSSGIVIENNITTGISIDARTTNADVRHNLCVPAPSKCVFGLPVAGKTVFVGRPGMYGDHNVIAGFDAKALFKAYDTVGMRYDITLKRSNPAAAKP